MGNQVLAVLIGLLSWLSAATASEPHRVPANSVGNRLVLTIENAGTERAEGIKLRIEAAPHYIVFQPSEVLLGPLDVSESQEVVLEFSVDRSAPTGQVDEVVLKIRSSTNMWQKALSFTCLRPTTFRLEQNFPNPFNPSTTIQYQLPTDGWVTLTIYDVLGRQVERLVDEERSAGYHDAIWRTQNAASGFYFYRLTVRAANASSFSDTKRMLLIR